ncbi:MAG TPA: hypothetical protein VHL61_10985, partial [Luteimonas sp.]|nr:hypothetical protein [Luteimonas sp.]
MPTTSVIASQPEPSSADDALRRELYFFSLYRVLESALLALMLFSPVGVMVGLPDHAPLAEVTTFVYLIAGVVLLLWAQRRRALRA